MNIAQSIMSIADRTPKERRDMAELRDIGPQLHGRVDWTKDCETCYFNDGSALMMVFDDDLSPTEFLVIAPAGHVDAIAHAAACMSARDGWDIETMSHNIETNFPDLSTEECESIAAAALGTA